MEEVFVEKKLNALRRNSKRARRRIRREGEQRGRDVGRLISPTIRQVMYVCVCVCDIVSSPFNKRGSCCSSALLRIIEVGTAGGVWGWGGEFRRDRCVSVGGRRDVLLGGRSLIRGFVRFQKLLRERVDLVGASDFVWQKWQFDYVEIFIKVLHL